MNEFPDILTIEIPDTNRILYLPLTLDKLDERQYTAFFELLYRLENKEIDFYDFSILLIYELLNLKKGNRKNPEQAQQALANIAQLAEYTTNFFNFNKNEISLKLEYTRNHIEKVKPVLGASMRGPTQNFQNVNFGQYEDGLNRFMQYNQTPSKFILAQLMAEFFFDRRKKLTFDQRVARLQNLPIGKLVGFYYTFAAFHTYFSGSQVYYNGQLIDLSILFQNTGTEVDTYQSPYPSLGIKSTTIEIAKTGVLGNLKEVRETPLWEVALLLYDMRKKDLDERARIKKQKNNGTN